MRLLRLTRLSGSNSVRILVQEFTNCRSSLRVSRFVARFGIDRDTQGQGDKGKNAVCSAVVRFASVSHDGGETDQKMLVLRLFFSVAIIPSRQDGHPPGSAKLTRNRASSRFLPLVSVCNRLTRGLTDMQPENFPAGIINAENLSPVSPTPSKHLHPHG